MIALPAELASRHMTTAQHEAIAVSDLKAFLQRTFPGSYEALQTAQSDAQTDHFSPTDGLVSSIFAMLAAAIAVWGFGILGPTLYNASSFNIWFQADTPRVIANLTDAASDHYRTSVHPASSILLTPIVLGLSRLGIAPLLAAKLVIISAAALSGGLFFAVLRLLGLPRFAAALFTLLYLSSATFLHWYSEIELNTIAGVTIVLALLTLAYGRTGSSVWLVLVSAATLSITVTNWSAGLIATLVRRSLTRFIVISGAALILVMLLSVAQYFLFRNASLFFRPSSVRMETQWTQPVQETRGAGTWRPVESLQSLLVTTVVAPYPEIEIQGGYKVVTNQSVSIIRNTLGGIGATIAWVALLGCGLLGAVRSLRLRPVALGLGLMLFSQMLLHSVYGNVTFLYAPHFLPMLVALASLSWFTPARRIALGLAVVVSVAGGISNVHQFQKAAQLAKQILDEGGNAISSTFPPKGVIAPAPPRR